MQRRQFMRLIGGAAAVWPFQARAELQAKVSRIGFLGLAPEFSGVEALRAGLRELGYIEGSNLIIEWRWAENVQQLPTLAADLVAQRVDLIIAQRGADPDFAASNRRASSVNSACPCGKPFNANLPSLTLVASNY
jgi:hypothetical protein